MAASKCVTQGGARRHALAVRRRRQAGAVAFIFLLSVAVIIGILGLALDLARLYNRRVELQNIADTVALAAALELDGTDQGIANALDRAAERFDQSATGALTYAYGTSSLRWRDQAIQFGPSPDGPWQHAGGSKGYAKPLLYVKVNTDGLGHNYGRIRTYFIRYLAKSPFASTGARAVAGHAALRITPLGICAMRDKPQRDHKGELEEYGFRRGVVYNLLELGRTSTARGETYLVNPVPGNTTLSRTADIAPFVCNGTMAMARVTGGKVAVSPGFPIADLYLHFNSRFGIYGGATARCNPRHAPPDANVKEYKVDGGTPWMAARPGSQSARVHVSDGRRWTVAGPDTAPAGTVAADYGPLWSYARAARFSAHAANEPEPPQGYATFEPSDWGTLYSPGLKPSTSTAYPLDPANPTPYSYTSGATFFAAPPAGHKSLRNRRVLNLPLLHCPVTGNRATVLAIGKFFMTVPATDSTLYGEFAGLTTPESLRTQVELYP